MAETPAGGRPEGPGGDQPAEPPTGQPALPPTDQPAEPPTDQPVEPPTGQPAQPRIRTARFGELDAATLYALLRLRVDVFVVEQHCPYPELDGRDTEAATRHCWVAEGGQPLAYLRLLDEGGGVTRLGRVVTAPAARGRGLAGALVRHALDRAEGPVVAAVQSHLADWYRGHGFRADGTEYVEDGIPHLPMRRP